MTTNEDRMQENTINYREEFYKIINHEKGRHFLLDFGGDQASVSIFAYAGVLGELGIERIPKINSFVQLSSLPEEEFLNKYKIGFRWLYPKPSRKMRELIDEFRETFELDVRTEIQRGYIADGSGKFFFDDWGVKWKRSAYYFEQVAHPLAGKSYDEIANYIFPDPSDRLKVENLEGELRAYSKENPQYIISLSQSYGGILETALWIRGYTDFYLDMGSNSKECGYLLDGLMEYFIEWYKQCLSSVDGRVDIVAIGDDYGMQDRMLLSPEMWKTYIKPRYKKLIDSMKSKYSHIKIFHHSCGSIFPIIEDLIEIGVDILNPIQPTAKDMDPKKLKRRYGNRITFHGGIDVQTLLPFGTTREIKNEVIRILEILSENGGYIIAPSHNIQAGTPVKNILAFYDTVNEYTERQNLM
jgi:uroporphyrinogen decarboxylase